MNQTYLSTRQLAERLPYSPRTIRDQLKDSVLLEGIHYVRPFGRRKIFYIWESIERDLLEHATPYAAATAIPDAVIDPSAAKKQTARNALGIPMANGGRCRG